MTTEKLDAAAAPRASWTSRIDLPPLWQPLFQGVVLLAAISLGAIRVFRVRNRLELFT